MLADLTPKQRALADYMSEISELAWSAGWMQDLEFILWRAIHQEGHLRFGRVPIRSEQTARLRHLSAQCGGWIVVDDEHEETWIATPDWERKYSAWEAVQPPDKKAY